MADDKKAKEKELKELFKKCVAAKAAMDAAINKVFPSWEARVEIKINAMDKAGGSLEKHLKGIDGLIRDYMLKKGIPEDGIKKMFPKYKADYNKNVLPKIIEFQNVIKDYRTLYNESDAAS